MWPFNRNRQQTTQKNVPEEVEQYYQSERRDRVSIAWLLAGATLVATVLIALVLFFGGRWVYRKIAHSDSGNQTATTQQTTNNKPAEQAPATTPQGQTSPNNSSSGSTSAPTSNSSSQTNPPSSSASQGTVAAPTQANNPSSVSSQPTQTTTPSTLTNTGPGDTVAIFLAVSLFGYLVHAAYARRKLSR